MHCLFWTNIAETVYLLGCKGIYNGQKWCTFVLLGLLGSVLSPLQLPFPQLSNHTICLLFIPKGMGPMFRIWGTWSTIRNSLVSHLPPSAALWSLAPVFFVRILLVTPVKVLRYTILV